MFEFLKNYQKERDTRLADLMAAWPVIQSGRHKGKSFDLIGDITKMGGYDGAKTLDEFADRGNLAAINAIFKDDYEDKDAPFYYGKIKDGDSFLGYILSHKDLYGGV